jgi:hypothetical protein
MKNGIIMLFIFAFLTTFCQAQSSMYVIRKSGETLVVPIASIDSITHHATLPTITTVYDGRIHSNNAIFGGFIKANGGAPVTARGLCWSTTPNPTISSNKSFEGSGSGSFLSCMTGLSLNTTYYVRAYATNSVGTAYGVEKSFTCQRDHLSWISLKSGGSEIALSPAFVGTTNYYTATVSFTAGMNVTITPTAENPLSTIAVSGTTLIGTSVVSGESLPVDLSVTYDDGIFTFNQNFIYVSVYTDGVLQQTYELNVTRKPEPNLSSLKVMSGSTSISLDPVFEPTHLEYEAYVDYNVDAVTVTPASESSTSYIEVASVGVASGAASDLIPLNVGPNDILIHVDEYGDVKDYGIKIIRSDSPPLNSLDLMWGSTNIALSPSFSSSILDYKASVESDVSSITITPTGNATGSFEVDGNPVPNGTASDPINLAFGINNIEVRVDDNGKNTIIYNVEATRHTSSYLSGAELKVGQNSIKLDSPFSKYNLAYSATSNVSPISFTATSEDPDAEIYVQLNSNYQINGKSSVTTSFALNPGQNNLSVMITPTDGGPSRTYNFIIKY